MTTAAPAPAVPATTKLATLQRKSSRQILAGDCRVDSAIAMATRPVLTTKYAAIAPTRGPATASRSSGATRPPRAVYAAPVTAIVIDAAATLNAVRYRGYDRLTLNVHWAHAPASATRSA
jgi:hypothetical protein